MSMGLEAAEGIAKDSPKARESRPRVPLWQTRLFEPSLKAQRGAVPMCCLSTCSQLDGSRVFSSLPVVLCFMGDSEVDRSQASVCLAAWWMCCERCSQPAEEEWTIYAKHKLLVLLWESSTFCFEEVQSVAALPQSHSKNSASRDVPQRSSRERCSVVACGANKDSVPWCFSCCWGATAGQPLVSVNSNSCSNLFSCDLSAVRTYLNDIKDAGHFLNRLLSFMN